MCLVDEQLIMPVGFGSMESLEELGNLDGCNCSINFGEDLALLNKLRVLQVVFMRDRTRDLETKIESLMLALCRLGGNNLQHVRINDFVGAAEFFVDSWCPPPRLLQKCIHGATYYPRFPKWISSCLCDLTYLDICSQKMERECFVFLKICQPFVSCILLKQIPEDGLIISHGAFQSLTHSQFYNVDGPGLVFEGIM
jgi:hypothetical protein